MRQAGRAIAAVAALVATGACVSGGGSVALQKRTEYLAYLSGAPKLAPIEGLWLFPDNSGELAIVRYPPSQRNEFDFYGIVVSSTTPSSVGTTPVFLKETASASTYVGTWAGVDRAGPRGVTAMMSTPNLVELAGLGGRGLLVRARAAQPGARSSGTGFFVARDLVATNEHVVADATTVTVQVGAARLPAEVLVQDHANDLALLRVRPEGGGEPARARCLALGDAAAVRPGTRVFALGYPLAEVLAPSVVVSEGLVSAAAGLHGDPTAFQVSAPIQPGSSGSPLVDEQGRVVGIMRSTLDPLVLLAATGAAPQGVNFAVKSTYLQALLPLAPAAACAPRTAAAPLTAAAAVEALGPAVVRVDVR